VSRAPLFGLGTIALCVLVQLWGALAFWYRLRGIEVADPVTIAGYVPRSGLHPTLLTSAFVHAGWVHLAGNLLFLYFTAFNLEDRWGLTVFGPFYLGGAVVSAVAFAAFDPTSSVPLVGASGAVAAAMGAFLVCFARTRLSLWYFWWLLPPFRQYLYVGTFLTRAYVAIPAWFALEVVNAVLDGGSMIARTAHVGGFLYGVAFAAILKASGMDARRREVQEKKSEVFAEDPAFLAALDHLARGAQGEARAALQALLARRDHGEARIVLARLLAETGDARAAAPVASRALLELTGAEPRRAVALFGELTGACPSLVLTDGALARVARAAAALGELGVAFDALRQLLLHHPDADEVPRALWEAAELQQRELRPDLARATLENLAAVFPTSSFALLARDKLAAAPP